MQFGPDGYPLKNPTEAQPVTTTEKPPVISVEQPVSDIDRGRAVIAGFSQKLKGLKAFGASVVNMGISSLGKAVNTAERLSTSAKAEYSKWVAPHTEKVANVISTHYENGKQRYNATVDTINAAKNEVNRTMEERKFDKRFAPRLVELTKAQVDLKKDLEAQAASIQQELIAASRAGNYEQASQLSEKAQAFQDSMRTRLAEEAQKFDRVVRHLQARRNLLLNKKYGQRPQSQPGAAPQAA